ncbi:MAG: chemosensory pili system protein ChpA (sensor histidine kinase/response regulator) [Cellvibrionaceae bacterium]|jgi:chemosensory pili system protein ChpA (sensor histidine kinase/response regulator)
MSNEQLLNSVSKVIFSARDSINRCLEALSITTVDNGHSETLAEQPKFTDISNLCFECQSGLNAIVTAVETIELDELQQAVTAVNDEVGRVVDAQNNQSKYLALCFEFLEQLPAWCDLLQASLTEVSKNYCHLDLRSALCQTVFEKEEQEKKQNGTSDNAYTTQGSFDDTIESSLSYQVDRLFEEFTPIRASLEAGLTDREQLLVAIDRYSDLLERLQTVNSGHELEMFNFLCDYISLQLAKLSKTESLFNEGSLALLLRWPECGAAYLGDPGELTSREMLADLMLDADWPGPLEDIDKQELISLLAPVSEGATDTLNEEVRSTAALPENILIEMDPNISAKLVDVFFFESAENINDLNHCLKQIANDGQEWHAALATAQRLAHNLKGSANLVGSVGMANLTHHLEDLLEYLVQCEKTPLAALSNTLLEAGDCLEAMLEAIEDGRPAPENALAVLQNVLDWANQMDSGELGERLAQSTLGQSEIKRLEVDSRPVSEPDTHTLENKSLIAENEKPLVNTTQYSEDPASLVTEKIIGHQEIAASQPTSPAGAKLGTGKNLRVSARIVDELWSNVESMSIALDQIRGQFDSLKSIHKEWRKSIVSVKKQQFSLEKYIDTYHLVSVKQTTTEDNGKDLFDPLEMDQFNELQTVSHGFIESVLDTNSISQGLFAKMDNIDRLFEPFNQKKDDLQRTVTQLRLVPFDTISSRLQRCVAQTCQALEKEAILNIEGGTCLVDSDILEKLSDPLMHMLRNALDHGIETPSVRAAKNKPPTGMISLRVTVGGQDISIKCVDDGAGLNYDKIKDKAIQSGIITDSETISQRELAKLVLQRGFSTSQNLTQLSGRGVGMDVVYDTIRSLKGKMDIGDAPNGGCRIAFKLPMLMISNHSLVVEVQGQLFAIPTWTIDRMVAPNTGKYNSLDGQLTVEIEQETFPATNLAKYLGLSTKVEPSDKNPFLLVVTPSGTMAIEVGSFVNSYHLIIKNLGDYIPSMHGIFGVSLLPDGSLIPVLDVLELLDLSAERTKPLILADETDSPAPQKEKYKIMIVDDSISMRQTLLDFVEKSGFDATVARDGMEAIELMRQKMPDIVLSDIEMPRMNGLELASHIRANYGSRLPIIMISSRSMKKHRTQATLAGANQYLTKPFVEDILLENINTLLSAES